MTKRVFVSNIVLFFNIIIIIISKCLCVASLHTVLPLTWLPRLASRAVIKSNFVCTNVCDVSACVQRVGLHLRACVGCSSLTHRRLRRRRRRHRRRVTKAVHCQKRVSA